MTQRQCKRAAGACAALMLSLETTAQPIWPTSAPFTQSAPSTTQVVASLAAIENAATSAERRAAARDALVEGGSAAAVRLNEILEKGAPAAKLAVARAIAETPQRADSLFTPALLALLESEGELRSSSVAALAIMRDDALNSQLSAILENPARREPVKLAAIEILGQRMQRDAIATLVGVLADPTSPLCGAALGAIERATAQDFGGDPAAALTWWQSSSDTALPAWQQLQIDRLVRQTTSDRQRVRVLETRLTSLLRDSFVRAEEPGRSAMLLAYLADDTDVVRLLGLELVLSRLTEGKSLSAEITAACRALLGAPEPAVRAAAARTVAALRDPSDADRFVARLAREAQPNVRQALVYGLGYLGGSGVLPTLLAVLAESDDLTRDEAVASIGRLAERGMVEGPARQDVISALLERGATARRSPASRERLTRAMSRLPDPRFAEYLVSSLAATESAAARLSAIRGIQFLVEQRPVRATDSAPVASSNSDPLLEALITACADDAPPVRRAAIEAIGAVGRGPRCLEAVWCAAMARDETDEGVRTAAWKALSEQAARLEPSELQDCSRRAAGDPLVPPLRRVEMLRRIEERAAALRVPAAALGQLRLELGKACASAARYDEAMEVFRAALADLQTSDEPSRRAAARGLLAASLHAGRYGESTADTLHELGGGLSLEAISGFALEEIAACLEPSAPARTCAMIAQLESAPPIGMTQDQAAELARLRVDAWALRDAADERRVAECLVGNGPAGQLSESAVQATLDELGVRAAPVIQRMLLKSLAEPAQSERERGLRDLLMRALPEWPGYALDAPPAQRRSAVESAGS